MAIDGPVTWYPIHLDKDTRRALIECPPMRVRFPHLQRQHLERAWVRMTGRLIDRAQNRARKARELRFPDPWVRMTCRLIDPSADSTWVPWDTRSFEYRRKWLPSCLLPRSRKAIELIFSRHRQITRNPALQMGRYTLYRHVALNTDSIDTVEVGTQTES